MKSRRRPFHISPPMAVVATYVGASLLGTVLFLMPFATREPGLGAVDALFLSTSAICVTGLLPVPSLVEVLSPAGWWVLLGMIQFGGIGLVLLGTVLFSVVGRRLPLLHARALGDSYADNSGISRILRHVLLATLAFEAAGALALYPCFSDQPGAVFLAVFHSVSAFCNAGFSNLTGGLSDFRGHLGVNVTIILLVLTGGFGFRVLAELARFLRNRRRHRLSLHAKLVLITSGVLVVLGALLFLAIEWGRPVLEGMSPGERMLSALFQSVCTRTAGFASVDISLLGSTTLLVFCFWMVVGGSPGSTAGGMKTVTLVVLLGWAISQSRGRRETTFLGRTLPLEHVRKAAAVATVYMLCLVVVVLLLTLVAGDSVGGSRPVLALFFEACSALGTVGLTTGITPSLPDAGKALLVLTMLIGRIGPLALLLSPSNRKRPTKLDYPEEPVALG